MFMLLVVLPIFLILNIIFVIYLSMPDEEEKKKERKKFQKQLEKELDKIRPQYEEYEKEYDKEYNYFKENGCATKEENESVLIKDNKLKILSQKKDVYYYLDYIDEISIPKKPTIFEYNLEKIYYYEINDSGDAYTSRKEGKSDITFIFKYTNKNDDLYKSVKYSTELEDYLSKKIPDKKKKEN